jgi:hypothetical protein
LAINLEKISNDVTKNEKIMITEIGMFTNAEELTVLPERDNKVSMTPELTIAAIILTISFVVLCRNIPE